MPVFTLILLPRACVVVSFLLAIGLYARVFVACV